MPFEFSTHTSPSGMMYLRIDAHGDVELEHALELKSWLEQPEHDKGMVLSVVAVGTNYKPKARKIFQQLDEHFTALAAVVTSPLVRTMINLMLKLNPGGGGQVRLFTDEAQAMSWLEAHPGAAGVRD